MKPILLNLILVLLAVVTSFNARSQDIHFTQYRQSPLTLNPANTGAIFGDLRLAGNFRSQWSAVLDKPFRTFCLSFDKPFFLKSEDRIGIGIVALNDQAGDVGYNTNRFMFSLSYIKLIGYQELRFGAQAGYTIHAIDSTLSFPEDFDPNQGIFDPKYAHQENFGPNSGLKNSSGYFDINVGLGWAANFGKFRPDVGLAFYHLNGPKETFFANSAKLGIRSVAHLSLKTFVDRKIFIDPNFLVMSMARAKNIIAGVNGGMKLQPNNARLNSFFIGVAARNGFSENSDAVMLLGGVNIATFDIGLSYDINLSSLRAGVSGNGSFEVSVIYSAPSSRLIKTKIDSERL